MNKLSGEVKNYKNKPTIFINNVPYSPLIYALPDPPGGRWSFEELPQYNIKSFAEIGFELFQVDLFLEHVWNKNNSIDLSLAQKQINGVLEVCPNAKIFFRFHVNAPLWWNEMNNNEFVKYDKVEATDDYEFGKLRLLNNDARLPKRISLASKKWKEEISEKFVKFLKEFNKTEEADSLVGIQVACGVYGEWHYWGFLKWEPDFSEPMQNHFREFIKNKYITEDILRIKWNSTEISFEKVRVPTTEERDTTSAGIFRDPKKDQKTIDYYECQHNLIADNVIHFCKIIKENWDRPIITGSFYGYFFSVFNRLAAGSQLEMKKILESKYIDYLCGPQAYEPEAFKIGEPYRSRSLIHSILLNGKLWLDEMDQEPKRTVPYLGSIEDNLDNYEKTIDENIALIKRNVMFSHSKGMGLWFYDFGPIGFHTNPDLTEAHQYSVTGYWDHPKYLNTIKELKIIWDKYLDKEYKSDADVLLVYDTEIQYHIKSVGNGDPVTAQIIDWVSLNSFYAGVVFDPIHILDLDKVNIDNYKCIVFCNTFLLRDNQKVFIKENIAKKDRTLLWIYAPGYTNGITISKDFVEDLTGFKLENIYLDKIPSLEISINDKKISLSPKDTCDPLFEITTNDGLGFFKDSNKIGFAKKNFESYKSFFISLPPTDFELLRYIYKSAGANIYNEVKDIVYSGNSITTYHTLSCGNKNIHLKNGKALIINMEKDSKTLLLDNETGEIIF